MRTIIKLRYFILLIFVVLFIATTMMIPKVRINYDASAYLPDEIKTNEGFELLEKEFGVNGICEVMVKNIASNEALALYSEFLEIENVKYVDFNIQSVLSYKNADALYIISFDYDNYHENTTIAIKAIEEKLAGHQYYLSGQSIIAKTYSTVLEKEIFKIIIILIPIVLLILLIMTSSWFEPVLFIINIVIAVIINMGSNIIFPSISYMTHATCGILQLALCMDYSVILLHSYRKYRLHNSKLDALKLAFKASLIPILSSSLTTIAGFIAIMMMRYKIGYDIGVVLTKGTVISLLATLILMPVMIYFTDSLLARFSHRSFLKTSPLIKKYFRKTKLAIPIVTLIIIVFAFFIQSNNRFAYSDILIANESKDLYESNKKIKETFGINNHFIIIIPANEFEKEGVLVQSIKNLTIEENIQLKNLNTIIYLYNKLDKNNFKLMLESFPISQESINNFLQVFDLMDSIYQESVYSLLDLKDFVDSSPIFTYEQKLAFKPFFDQLTEAKSMLTTLTYHRIVFRVDLDTEGDNTFEFVRKLDETVAKINFDKYYIISESNVIYDIKGVVDKDLIKTTTISIILVFIIIMISFRSLLVPFILVLLIQGGIWINMSFPVLYNQNLLIIGYIIVSSIQLASTIDYGILYSSLYIANKKTSSKHQAQFIAFDESKTTVLTSGLILIFAGFTLSMVSTIPSISVFGSLIGRGGLISTILILFTLPSIYDLNYKP